MSEQLTSSTPEHPKLSRRHLITGVGSAAAGAVIGGAVVSSPAYAQPITYEPGFSGPANFAHGDTVTITGPGGTAQGFGTKSVASPLVWDDCSGPDSPLDKWTGAHPNLTSDSFLHMKRRNPIRGVNPPHNIVGRYLAGSHYNNGEAFHPQKGPNVFVWKEFPFTPPGHFYASYWQMVDPAWTFNSAGDDNFKCAVWSHVTQSGNPPYKTGNVHINFNYAGGGPGGVTSLDDDFVRWQIYSSAQSTMLGNGSPTAYAFYGQALDCLVPMGRWVKYEHEGRMTPNSDGFIRIYENGRLVLNYNGRTDADPAALRSFAVGGFARNQWDSTNWRYFTDIYVDNSLGRVIVGNNAMNVREVQYPTAWTDTSITFKCWRGAHGTLAGKSLYVVSTRSPNNAIKVATIG